MPRARAETYGSLGRAGSCLRTPKSTAADRSARASCRRRTRPQETGAPYRAKRSRRSEGLLSRRVMQSECGLAAAGGAKDPSQGGLTPVGVDHPKDEGSPAVPVDEVQRETSDQRHSENCITSRPPPPEQISNASNRVGPIIIRRPRARTFSSPPQGPPVRPSPQPFRHGRHRAPFHRAVLQSDSFGRAAGSS